MPINSNEMKESKNEFEPKAVEIFNDADEFENSLKNEERGLIETSCERREAGEVVKDQDFEIKFFGYDGGEPNKPALLIIGGMGPLAGVQAGEMAAEKLVTGEKKINTALYQLTATPDRTEGIKEKAAGNPEKYDEVIRVLEEGINTAVSTLKSKLGNKDAKIVIICNTAHNYIDDLAKKLPQGVEIVSILESATEYLKNEAGENPDLKVASLYTDGTKKQKLYSSRFDKNGISYEEPDEESQANLMKAIYEGVKAFDEEKTLAFGEKALKYLVDRDDITHLLAGCTEIPEVLAVVKRKTNVPGLKEKLEKIETVDPVEKAFTKAM